MMHWKLVRGLGLSVLLATACAVSATPAEGSDSYSVLIGGVNVGTLDARAAGGRVDIAYDYKNNGRGPTISESLVLGDGGLPTSWTVKGSTTFGSLVDERFEQSGSRASWVDVSGPGAAELKAPALYVAQSASPWAFGLYARALKAAGGQLSALPGGTLTLETLGRTVLRGTGGALPVTAYGIGGIGLDRTTVFLGDDSRMAAFATPEFLTVRKGYEAEDVRVRGLVAGWDVDRLKSYQKAFAHRPSGTLRIRNVRVFDPKRLALGVPSDVLVKGKRIVAVEPTGRPATRGETIVDGKGGTLFPGLTDMHAHLGQNEALMNLLAGVTTVRDMANDDAVLDRLAERIEAGELAGPRVVRSGFIEGKSATSARYGTVVDNEADAVKAVQDAAKRGVFQIKIYNSMNPAWVPAMIRQAHALGLRVAGHIPAFTTTDAMLEAGYDEITHANQLMLNWVLKEGDDTRTLLRITALKRFDGFDLDGPAPTRTLALMKLTGAAHDPTLVIMETATFGRTGQFAPGAADWAPHMPLGIQRDLKQAMLDIRTPEDDAAFKRAFATTLETMRRLHTQGTLIVPGTDLGGHFWLHRELKLYTLIGMTNAEVLKRATADVADYLGRGDRFGRVAPGMMADLVLVAGNPLADIRATKAVSMVVKDGQVYFPAEAYRALGIRPFADPPEMAPGHRLTMNRNKHQLPGVRTP
jgi:imidazolonepropionase-like amidohydrolase